MKNDFLASIRRFFGGTGDVRRRFRELDAIKQDVIGSERFFGR